MFRLFKESNDEPLLIEKASHVSYYVKKITNNQIAYSILYDGVNKCSAKLEIMTTDKTLQFLSFSYLDKQEWGNFKYWELLLTGTHPEPGMIAVSRMPGGGDSLQCDGFEDTIQLWIKNIFLLHEENMRINPETATKFYSVRCKEVLEQFKTATAGFNRQSGEKAIDLISGIFAAEVENFKNYALSQQLQDEELPSTPVFGSPPTC